MKRSGLLFWIPLALFAALAVVFALDLGGSDREQPVQSAMVGKPLPQFALPASINGSPGIATGDLADGTPRLLNIFASWCIPCAVEAPQLEALKANGAEIYAVAIRDKPEDVARFLDRYGNPFTRIGADDRSEVQLGLGASGVPETFVIDGRGVIRYQHIGEIRPEHVPLLLAELRKAGE